MQRAQRRTHRRLWIILSIIVAVIFVASVVMKQDVPIETQRIQMSSISPVDTFNYRLSEISL